MGLRHKAEDDIWDQLATILPAHGFDLMCLGSSPMTLHRQMPLFAFAALLLTSLSVLSPQADAASLRLAFLGVRIQNDNEALEPTTKAERDRMTAIGKQFTSSLEGAGGYAIVPLTDDVRAKIANGQAVGSCGGCEAAFGKQFKADRVAWITVQKVSNLILNMNVYIADPATDKYTFIKSVDIRGNTDESWSRSLTYLLDNYFFERKS
jgi:hypothetical protein